MLPRWHILLGAIFTLILYIAVPEISLINLSLVFLSSFLIDFDHYLASLIKTKKLSLKHSFEYHKQVGIKQQKDLEKGIKTKGDFHLFHTIEFHILIAVLSIFFNPLFYVFIGMLFHSLLDIISLLQTSLIHVREYFLFNWLKNNL